jgi:hypothetical protein
MINYTEVKLTLPWWLCQLQGIFVHQLSLIYECAFSLSIFICGSLGHINDGEFSVVLLLCCVILHKYYSRSF